MLRWSWVDVIGTMTSCNGVEYEILEGNCLGVVACKYKDKDGKSNWHVGCEYWNDAHHLGYLLGLEKANYTKEKIDYPCYTGYKNIRVNTFYGKEALDIAKAFVKAGHKVTLYYKVPKKSLYHQDEIKKLERRKKKCQTQNAPLAK